MWFHACPAFHNGHLRSVSTALDMVTVHVSTMSNPSQDGSEYLVAGGQTGSFSLVG